MDPGTAVGVISLGIQVCEGILKYYRDWKGYEDDIQGTYTEIDHLAKTFALLYDELQMVSQKALAIRAQECLATCQDGIQQLEKKLKKLHKDAPAGLRQRAEVGALRLMYPFRKSTLEKLKEIAQGLMQQLNFALQIIYLSNSHSAQLKADQIQSTLDTTEEFVKRIKATTLITQTQVSATAASVQALLSVEQSREVLEILKWLDAPDPTTNHTQARVRYETGTGEWLLNSQGYQDWISGSSPLLWLHGKAGCCKTILCSTVIEQVFGRVSGQDNVAFAYFYFSFSDAQKQNYTSVLLSMVAQLSRKRSVHPLLRAAYSQAPSQKPSSEVLEHIFLALLEESRTSYLVVDALDECSEEQREKILEGFRRITQSLPEIRLPITSRKEADIEDLLSSWPVTRFTIDEESVNQDIDLYVKNALATDRKLVKLPSATKKEIEDEFRKKSDGMGVSCRKMMMRKCPDSDLEHRFRWAALQLDNIRNLKILRPKYISLALYEMPRTLDETYARILSSIDNLYFDEARAALEWLAFSLRPLSVAELAEACSIRVDNFQEPIFEEGGYEALVGLFSVLSSLIVSGDQSDYDSDYGRYRVFTNNPLGDPLPKKYDTTCYNQTVRLAHFSVKEYLVSNRLPATFRGNEKVVEILVASGADVNYKGGTFGTALQTAAFEGNATIVNILITNGADVNCEAGHFGTALQAAAYRGHEIIVDMLIANGADVKYHGNRTRFTALIVAASKGYGGIVSKLVKADVDNRTLNVKGEHGTALDQAAGKGHEQIVEELLLAGADHGDTMEIAMREGQEGIVRILIKYGAAYEPAGEV
ncbi:unnamed protein product [Alternaria alternata]